jgi:hypothetical protein
MAGAHRTSTITSHGPLPNTATRGEAVRSSTGLLLTSGPWCVTG